MLSVNENGIKLTIEFLKHESIHFHREIELLYLLDGEADFYVTDDVFHLKKEEIILINNEKKHSIVPITEGIICRILIDFSLLSSYLSSTLFWFWCNSTMENQKNYEELRKVLRKILAYHLQYQGEMDFGQTANLYQLMDLLIKNFMIDKKDIRFQKNNDVFAERIHQILDYIMGNYKKDLRLNELAEKLYLSNAYLSRFFKKNFGMNFKDYLTNIRLHYAVDDILNTEKTLTKVAMDNGFASVSRFNQIFKETYQISPSAYRESSKQKDEKDEKELQKEQKEVFLKLQSYMKEYEDSFENEKKEEYHIIYVTQTKPCHKNWNRIINIGTMEYLLQAEVQKYVLQLHEELGYTYIRLWNIFSDGIVSLQKVDCYNFDKMDRVLDFLLKSGIQPFLVLGAKPRIVIKTITNNIIDQQSSETEFFKDPQKWEGLFRSWLEHIAERYGKEVVSKWVFELWKPNEWDNVYEQDYLSKWYVEWFEITLRLIKKYFPQVLIGGCEFPAIGNDNWKTDIIQLQKCWQRINFVPDFLSIAVYPYTAGNLSAEWEYLNKSISYAREIFDEIGYDNIPLMVTEWNLTLSNRNILNDSCFKGSYIIRNMLQNISCADKIIYWMGTDQFSEYADSSLLLFGASGLLTKTGIRKPSFYAFLFLNRLLRYQIAKTEQFIATTDGEQNYVILFQNEKRMGHSYFMSKNRWDDLTTENYENYFLDLKSLELKVQLKNIEPGSYRMRNYTVSQEHGSILDEWKSWDCLSNLKQAEMDYLKQICQPKFVMRKVNSQKDELNFEINIPANAFTLVELTHIQIF
ncbi:AraC family transcriptional regulator [Anaerosacchariphilus polymeriproducens]|uniref:AraC family transcriptional regulator n=1 Tax=Anaerosacchariphilus polymeriproducens TaxID=1812858 RepID=UPI0013903960|nr:helix-turn-helix domain-containing protein [Anaerosacchariphilus polymeriproducens]